MIFKGFKEGDHVSISTDTMGNFIGQITDFEIQTIGVGQRMLITVLGQKFVLSDLLATNKIRHIFKKGALVRCSKIKGIIFKVLEDDGSNLIKTDAGMMIARELSLFTNFEIGDTVWTIKRGKGKIIGHYYSNSAQRQFTVDLDGKARHPKTINIFPTEELMLNENNFREKWNEGLTKIADAIDGEALLHLKSLQVEPLFGCEKSSHINDAKPFALSANMKAFTLPWYSTVKTSPCPFKEEIEKYSWRKFKIGDEVFYNGKKWNVTLCDERGWYELINEKYIVFVREHEIRAWEYTKFTHMVGSFVDNPADAIIKPVTTLRLEHYKSTKYLGKIFNGMDAFHCECHDGCIALLLGKKGDDI